ncbi:hypothetical protein PJO48_29620, partial [Mycobacterium kansasii]
MTVHYNPKVRITNMGDKIPKKGRMGSHPFKRRTDGSKKNPVGHNESKLKPSISNLFFDTH